MYRLLAALLLGALFAADGLQGQDKKDDKKAPPVLGVLPANWGRLELSVEQKKKVYTIQDDYRKKIDDLERQLSEMKARRDKDLEAVLTEEQKKKWSLIKTGKDPADEKKP